jgi:hypothetical protein
MTVRYARHKNLITRWYGGEAFVITPTAIENLSPLSALVWRWLVRPHSEDDICLRVQQLYPGVDQLRIAEDVRRLLKHFKTKALVSTLSAPAARKAARPRSTRR